MTAAAPARSGLPLERLLAFLDQDPANPTLLADAAWAAFEAGELDQAAALLARRAQAAALTGDLVNLDGLIALQQQRFADAAQRFGVLLEDAPDEPGLRFNLAWCRAMLADWPAVDALLDEATIALAPRAASLKIEALHHQGRLDEALQVGEALAAARPDDQTLMAALATAALDNERRDLAGVYAARAPDAPQGLSTLGMLMLEDDRVDDSLGVFDRALEREDGNARALIGKGLVLMLKGEGAEAAAYLDRGAESFGHHLGSWVAAAWARFTIGDYAGARERFERVVALDDTFAEGHGGLAVLDILDGDPDSGRRRAEIAARLDRESFSAALARTLLLQAAGNEAAARRIVETALATPLTPGGKTLAQAMVGLSGMGRG